MIKKTTEQVIASALRQILTQSQFEKLTEELFHQAMEDLDDLDESSDPNDPGRNFHIDTLMEMNAEMEEITEAEYQIEKAQKRQRLAMVPRGY